MLAEYREAITRVSAGEEACSLTVKLMRSILRVQYGTTAPAGARRGDIMGLLATAMAERPLVEKNAESTLEVDDEPAGDEEDPMSTGEPIN